MKSFEKVYRGIMKALYEGRLLPGQRLIAPSLMLEFEASRNTIREVLNRLAATGIVTMVPNQSATIRMMSRSEVVELLEVVEALLILASNSAAKNISRNGNRSLLEEAAGKLVATKDSQDIAKWISARENYYRVLLQICGNRELIRLFPTMHVHLMRLQLREEPHATDGAQLKHFEDLTSAILADDPTQATRAAQAHAQHMINFVQSLPDSLFVTA